MLARHLFNAIGSGALLSALALTLAVTTEGCGADSQGATSGRRVVLHTRVAIDKAALSKFTSTVGWDITLSAAAVSAGPFHYFDGVPPLVQRDEQRTWQYAAHFLGLGTAHAHPGHYQAGNAMGQMLESSSANLRGGAVDFPDGDGITGVYRSARFTLAQPSGSAAKLLNGHVAMAEGLAERAGQPPRYFRAFADLSDVEAHASKGRVEGCELKEVDVRADGTITASIDPRVWFELVDFSGLAEGSADAPVAFSPDSDAQIGFVLGVSQLSAYTFSYDTP
jgi:hypothetical protein